MLREAALRVTGPRVAVLSAVTDRRESRAAHPADGSLERYEARAGDNHHLVCRSCGAIADVDCTIGYSPCLTTADHVGFEIDEADVLYWSRCPDRVGAASAGSGG